MPVVMSPNHRFAVVGKTGSGKTVFSAVLAAALVEPDDPTWQVWWLDSKRDPRDRAMLRQWGFGRTPARQIFTLDPANGDISWQAQELCHKALERKNVLVVADEYKHIVYSTRRAGSGIQGIHLRGRGLNTGIIGQTQEPVEIPRQLLSQATHVFLFDLSYPADIKYARSLYEDYRRPPDRNGFYYCHIDGAATWHYYPHVRAWHETLNNRQEQPA